MASIFAALEHVYVEKENLPGALRDRQAHSSNLASFALQWKDMEEPVVSILRLINHCSSEMDPCRNCSMHERYAHVPLDFGQCLVVGRDDLLIESYFEWKKDSDSKHSLEVDQIQQNISKCHLSQAEAKILISKVLLQRQGLCSCEKDCPICVSKYSLH
ncbi:hypothetical protein HHK36_023965 [Tetracentron sinense]|uniref:Uncharacterized protein n=1 Tax=Tetracentron sinense TaxID=13715 RepID=A0A834YS34_TETSI|nr:hypothetical protein HHK36_023965 [Tetracentron sinense]